MKIRLISITCCCLAFWINKGCLANATTERHWSILLYTGATAKEGIAPLVGKLKFHSAGENLYSMELAYALDKNNRIICFVQPVINEIQIAGNLAERYDYNFDKHATEFDGYIMIRRTHFPWDHYLLTSLAAGEGISYSSPAPPVENGITGRVSPKLLNFLTFEITFALPRYPYLQLVARIHHRSACYGLYYPKGYNSGSNNVGIGIRYYFY